MFIYLFYSHSLYFNSQNLMYFLKAYYIIYLIITFISKNYSDSCHMLHGKLEKKKKYIRMFKIILI